MPGRIEKTGTNFKINDSEYFISLKSGEEIKVVLRSILKMISLDIDIVSEEINSSLLTLEGLEPHTAYYLYQDSYKNEISFISDEKGSYN